MPTPIPTTSVHAAAPGSVGNLGPGLDLLGCAVTGLMDEVWASWGEQPGVVVRDAGHPELPSDPRRHTAAIAAAAVLARAGRRMADAPGVALTVRKGLPIAGGQGGSAASAVAGALATNALLGEPLTRDEVLLAALEGETAVAGGCHADNVAPILLGGIVLVRATAPLDVIPLPVPPTLRVVLAHPAQRLRTAEARAVLPATLSRQAALQQAAQVAALVAALHRGDLALLRRAVDDAIAEPARAPLLPGFVAAKRAALDAGAHGCSISGAGPTSFAFADGDAHAGRIALAMRKAYEEHGVPCTTRVAAIDQEGARLVAAPTPAGVR